MSTTTTTIDTSNVVEESTRLFPKASKAIVKQFTQDWKSFDLTFFRGTSIFSKTIQLTQEAHLGSGEWSHVGIVLHRDKVRLVEPDVELDQEWYVWESTVSNILINPEVQSIKGGCTSGVQIRPLLPVMHAYRYSAAVSHLKTPIQLTDQEWIDLYSLYQDVGYECNCCRLGAAILACLRCCSCCSKPAKSDTKPRKRLFCSEFVADVLIRCKRLSSNVDAAFVTPMDLLGFDKDYDIPTSICTSAPIPVAAIILKLENKRAQEEKETKEHARIKAYLYTPPTLSSSSSSLLSSSSSTVSASPQTQPTPQQQQQQQFIPAKNASPVIVVSKVRTVYMEAKH